MAYTRLEARGAQSACPNYIYFEYEKGIKMTDKGTPVAAAADAVQTISKGKVVSFNYRMYEVLTDGSMTECLEESYSGNPIHYLHGFRNIISGLESAFEGKKNGESFSAQLDPISAYGPRKDDSIKRVPLKHLQFQKPTKKPLAGMIAGVKTEQGMRSVVVVKPGKFSVDVDFNHPLAGKTLNYEIEVLSVRDATDEEIAHRHVHGPGGHHH